MVRVCNYSSAIYSINSAARAFKPTAEKEQKKKSRLAARINNLRRICDCDGALRYFCVRSWYIFASSGAMAIGDVGKGGRSSASRVYVYHIFDRPPGGAPFADLVQGGRPRPGGGLLQRIAMGTCAKNPPLHIHRLCCCCCLLFRLQKCSWVSPCIFQAMVSHVVGYNAGANAGLPRWRRRTTWRRRTRWRSTLPYSSTWPTSSRRTT